MLPYYIYLEVVQKTKSKVVKLSTKLNITTLSNLGITHSYSVIITLRNADNDA